MDAEYEFERFMMEATENLSRAIDFHGILPSDLAKKMGKSKKWIYKVLEGRKSVSIKDLVECFTALGYRPHLYFGSGTSPFDIIEKDPGNTDTDMEEIL